MRRTLRFSVSIVLSVMWFCFGAGSPPAEGCSSFTLVVDGSAVFAANYDNDIHEGMLYINKPGLLKTGWTEGTTGETARWISKYASVTVNQATYHFPWAGMNEKGLSLSTMALRETVPPAPDERPPLEYGPLWMQYILDTCATIEDVIASDIKVRLVTTVDHYLVADRTGKSAVIEFLDGEMVVHTGGNLQVSALTNSPYEDSLGTWQLHSGSGNESCTGQGDSLERFCTVAGRVDAFRPTNTEDAVDYAFETLGIVDSMTPWSIVFDTRNLRAYFRTQPHDGDQVRGSSRGRPGVSVSGPNARRSRGAFRRHHRRLLRFRFRQSPPAIRRLHQHLQRRPGSNRATEGIAGPGG